MSIGKGRYARYSRPSNAISSTSILGRDRVDLAAAVARVHESAQAHMRDGARLARGRVPEHVGDHALGQVVGQDLVCQGQLLQFGHQTPVAADHSPHQPFVRQVVQPALLAIPLARGVDQCQIARGPGRQEAFLQLDRQLFGEADADEPARGDRVAVTDQATASSAVTTLLRFVRSTCPPHPSGNLIGGRRVSARGPPALEISRAALLYITSLFPWRPGRPLPRPGERPAAPRT